MKEPAGHRFEVLKEICNRIVMKHAEVVGMALIELDCGCINVGGVSFDGEPVGSITSITLHQETENDKNLVCFRCLEEKGRITDRVINYGLIWPGDENDLPEKDFRLSIGQKVFGPDYKEE